MWLVPGDSTNMHTAPSLYLSLRPGIRSLLDTKAQTAPNLTREVGIMQRVCWPMHEAGLLRKMATVSKWTKLAPMASQLPFAVVSRILVLAPRPCK